MFFSIASLVNSLWHYGLVIYRREKHNPGARGSAAFVLFEAHSSITAHRVMQPYTVWPGERFFEGTSE